MLGMKRTITLGTRGSRLALAQAEAVARELSRLAPDVDLRLEVVSTEGDRVTVGPLLTWGRGVFVREIELALLRGEIDLAVHSLKDIPPELPDGLALVGIPPRADASDVLVTADGRDVDSLPSGARVGTSSLRRAAFLRARRPDLAYVPIRGNVDTRWRKLLEPQQGYDALVLAAAGLERLGLSDVPRVSIPVDALLPAPGQGALALEARADDEAGRTLGALINHAPSAAAVAAERQLLRDLEGGCQLPVAALATTDLDGALRLAAAVAAPDGSQVIKHAERGAVSDPRTLGAAVARRLRELGAAELLGRGSPGVQPDVQLGAAV